MLKEEKINFCVSLDGSDYSEYGLDLVLNELMGKDDKVNIVHIKVPDQEDLPFQAQYKSIKSYSESKCISKLTFDKYSIQFKDPEKKFSHPILQIYDIANYMKFDNMVIGYQGPIRKKEKNVISKGMTAIITQVHLPVFIVKEYIPRNKCENNGYIWLVCIDKHHCRSWKAFNSALNFIQSNDTVICTHFSSCSNEKKKIFDEFTNLCQQNNIKNTDIYSTDFDNSKSIAYQINDYINHCQKTPNFVVLGHNPEKYCQKSELTSPAVEIMKQAQTNIYIHS